MNKLAEEELLTVPGSPYSSGSPDRSADDQLKPAVLKGVGEVPGSLEVHKRLERKTPHLSLIPPRSLMSLRKRHKVCRMKLESVRRSLSFVNWSQRNST